MSRLTPSGPAGWRQYGLLALLALIALLLLGRGCAPEPAVGQSMRDAPLAATAWPPTSARA